MRTVDEALGEILSRVERLKPCRLPLSDCSGLVLAEDLISREDQPPFDNSAMDGYAVRQQDSREASPSAPVRLRIVDEIPAGRVPGRTVGAGEASHIMTGAMIPTGADAVVPVENVTVQGLEIELTAPVRPGEHIRATGEHIRDGERVVPSGSVLGPAEIGMAALLGYPELACYPRPRVAILATGDELVEPGAPMAQGQIRNSNSYALEAQVRCLGAIPVRLGIVPDDEARLEQVIRQKLPEVDAFVTSAGVSVGKHDYVLPVLERLGGELLLWKIRMRPGKPLGFGRLDGRPFFGLPGNPVSSMVGFEVFVRPALLRMMGHLRVEPPSLEARLGEPVSKRENFRFFLRCQLAREGEGWFATTTGPQGSNILKSLIQADGLMELPEERSHLDAGEKVKVRLLWNRPLPR
ncbi:MAG: molybdopterin molybdotransferase MoeA [Armatimonadetes bacterium]|nr:molybdopterin molybdotransferase MoeA [Armatimonadota bacterium]